jgi:hypothetical protein
VEVSLGADLLAEEPGALGVLRALRALRMTTMGARFIVESGEL